MPKVKKNIQEIVRRWKSESPEFFNKTKKLGGWFTFVGGILALFPPTIPASIVLATLGSTMYGMSKLPVKGISEKEAKDLVEKLHLAELELEKLKTTLN